MSERIRSFLTYNNSSTTMVITDNGYNTPRAIPAFSRCDLDPGRGLSEVTSGSDVMRVKVAAGDGGM